jgi:hypothetical protein
MSRNEVANFPARNVETLRRSVGVLMAALLNAARRTVLPARWLRPAAWADWPTDLCMQRVPGAAVCLHRPGGPRPERCSPLLGWWTPRCVKAART